jgi:hypothetical protein
MRLVLLRRSSLVFRGFYSLNTLHIVICLRSFKANLISTLILMRFTYFQWITILIFTWLHQIYLFTKLVELFVNLSESQGILLLINRKSIYFKIWGMSLIRILVFLIFLALSFEATMHWLLRLKLVERFLSEINQLFLATSLKSESGLLKLLLLTLDMQINLSYFHTLPRIAHRLSSLGWLEVLLSFELIVGGWSIVALASLRSWSLLIRTEKILREVVVKMIHSVTHSSRLCSIVFLLGYCLNITKRLIIREVLQI